MKINNKIIGWVLIMDGIISLVWGLDESCLACMNNSQIGNIVRIIRIIIGIIIMRWK